MAELVVTGFEGVYRAAEVLDEIQKLDARWTIDLRDAVAVYRTHNGRLRVDHSVLPTSQEEGIGLGLLGALVGGLLLAPFTAGASTAVAATTIGFGAVTGGTVGAVYGAEDAADWKRTWGISEEFVREVGGMVQPGQSALFVFARVSEPEALAEHFRGYGGKILRSTLSPEMTRKLQDTIAVQSAAPA